MRTRLATILLTAALVATAAGCSSDRDDKPEPSKSPHSTATPSTAPALNKAEVGRRCANAVADQLANGDKTDDENRPAECETLNDSAYMDAVFKGTQQANQAARDELQRQIDEAAEEDAGN